MNIYELISPKIREHLLVVRGILDRKKNVLLDEIELCSREDAIDWYSNSSDALLWKKAMKRLTLESENRGIQLAREFYKQPLQIIEEKQIPCEQTLVLICVAKNESENMERIYQYYRKMGIKSFAFIDNNSTDDSVELYRSMKEVNVYFAKDAYTSLRRQAWINRIIAHYGFDKWYLVIDSDEYLDFNQSESHSVQDILNFCYANKLSRMHALMVDMYPKEIIYQSQDIDFLKEYKYFDKDTYEGMQGKNAILLKGYQGGVRARLFSSTEISEKPWLTKTPLFYFERGDIQFQSHMSFPFYKNFQSKHYLVLRHYKFLPSDLEKYKQRVKNGNFANGSHEYKCYVSQMEKGYIKFYCEKHSEHFLSSESFYNIPIITKIPWEE